ncbi:glycosyltransferase family 2 protein [Flavobacterium psychrotolerans]|uniref:Glycosyltransferase n=1 Tax=Flavobacterium psychrotolerans TaxID=2169410 RepID=A0A2U1JIP3_9FLAO|nr:glycosyltransferase family 2 protein [Flavobacterium psychrotolerans]PWA04885.1 glycosyltransferase [Flavobacterium psychrotolerans]
MYSKQFPLISIITVVYNGSKTLDQTIQSVINQSYKNIEYIIIDGGSTDGTIDIIKKYEKHISHWISEADKGLYDAMNKGIALAKGELIGMINSDDWYELDAVEIVVDAYLKNPDKRLFHGDRYDIDNEGNRRKYKFNKSKFKFIYFSMTYNHPSMFIHKNIYNIYKYNIELKSISDYEFVLKVFLKNSDFFYYIPLTYVNYRLDGISAKQSLISEIKEGTKARLNAGLKYHHVLVFIILKLIRSILRNVFRIKYIS